MKNIIFSIFTACLLLSCSDSYELVNKYDDQQRLSESFQIDKKSGLMEGTYTKYFPNGKVEQLAEYKRNKLDGQRVLFYENGDTLIIETYENAEYQGVYKSFYADGVLESVGQYSEGAMNGQWKFYYDNKQLKEEVGFVNNEEDGPFVEYHKNGKLKAKGTYKTTEENIDSSNREHGPLEMYDEEGELFKKMDCVLGVCRTTWSRDEES